MAMKELQTSKPLILGIIGLPGAGKTHFAREFSEMFGAPVVEMDVLRQLVFGDRNTSKDDEDGLKRLYWHLATEQAKSKHTFILDGNLSSYGTRSEARTMAKKAGYEILWIWVQTSELVARDRSTRAKRGGTNTIMSQQAFDNAVKSFELPRNVEPHVVTSGQRTFSSQVRPILARLAEAHQARLQAPHAGERTVESPQRPNRDLPPRRNIFIR